MYHEQLKHLWRMRFKKIFETEKESFRFYKDLLQKNKLLLKNSKARLLIRQLMREEIQHARMARELLKIVDRRIAGKREELDVDKEIS